MHKMALTMQKPTVACRGQAASRKAVVVRAQKDSVAQVAGKVALAATLATTVALSAQPAFADIAGLTPCSESKAYAKRQKAEVKALQKRLKNVSRSVKPQRGL